MGQAGRETVRVERMGYGAAAVGRLASGKAVFVEGAAPGDVAVVEVLKEKPSYAQARVAHLVEEGSSRAKAPACAGSCGGCPWAHLSYEAQVEAKRANVAEALARLGGVEAAQAQELVAPCVPSKRQWGYRNKVEFACGLDGAGNLAVGRHAPGAHDIVPEDSCPLAYPAIQGAPRALRGALRFVLGGQDVGLFRIGVRHSVRTGDTEVALWTRPGAFPRKEVAKTVRDALKATSIVRVMADDGAARKVRKVEVLAGRGCWREQLGGFEYLVSAPSFFQVNTGQAERLVRLALDGLDAPEGAFAADLYAGVGTFTLPLAERGCSVVAVESAGSSVRDLRRNADVAGLPVDVLGGDAVRELAGLDGIEALVVDPPRSGLGKPAIDAIAKAAPAALAYVSCDPQTWARDVALLGQRGYRLRAATPVDMFPQTYHVEVCSLFARE